MADFIDVTDRLEKATSLWFRHLERLSGSDHPDHQRLPPPMDDSIAEVILKVV